MCSPMLEPLKARRVGAALALDDVAAVARDPTGTCRRRAPSSAVSLPRLPSTKSLPPPPISVSAPSPPSSVSLPLPPSSVTASSVNEPAALVDPELVVAAAGLTAIAVNVLRSKREVGGAVVADVDLQRAGRARLEPERELVGRPVAEDGQRPVLDARSRGGQGATRARAEECRHCRGGQGAQDERPPPACRRRGDAFHRKCSFRGCRAVSCAGSCGRGAATQRLVATASR